MLIFFPKDNFSLSQLKLLLKNKKNMLLITILCCIGLISSQDCPSNWQLSNLLQIQREFQLQNVDSEMQETFSFPFMISQFDQEPIPMLSLGGFEWESFSQLDFLVTAFVQGTDLKVYVIWNHIRWSKVKVIVWLSARDDIVVGYFDSREVLTPGTSQFDKASTILTMMTSRSVSFYNQPQTWYLNFLNGLTASSTSTISVNITSHSRTQDTYSVEISHNSPTTLSAISFYYLIFNVQISLFSSGGGFHSHKSSLPSYHKVHRNFVPIKYRMVGFDKLTVSPRRDFSLELSIDDDYILGVSSSQAVEMIRVVYLTIGQKTDRVCEACDNFIFTDQCIDMCPQHTYPYLGYPNGGKSCLTCSPKVHEVLNQDRTGCTCLDGFVRNAFGVCAEPFILPNLSITTNTTINTTNTSTAANTTTNTTTNTTATNTATNTTNTTETTDTQTPFPQCSANETQVNGVCICDNNSIFLAGGYCFRCIGGSFKQNNECIKCKQNCQLCVQNDYCVRCSDNFTLIDGQCVGEIVSTVTCSQNETLVKDQCVCDEGSIRLDDQQCFKCVTGSFKSENNCLPCMINCLACNSTDSCTQCALGYQLDSEICVLACGENEVLQDGVCVCDGGSILLENGTCVACVEGSYKNNNTCFPCVRDCVVCVDGASCQQCIDGYVWEEQCIQAPPVCSQNETLVNRVCVCDDRSVKVDDRCLQCASDEYKDGNTCQMCDIGCVACVSADICTQCSDNFTFQSGGCECIEGHYLNGTECVYSPSEIRLVKARVLSNGIVAEFQAVQPIKPQQFTHTMGEGDAKPMASKVIFSQPNRIKVFDEYCLLPPTVINVTYGARRPMMVEYDLRRKEARVVQ